MKLSRVVGVPDPRLDQVVVACITLKDGAEATEADVQAFLREVSAYKVPKRVLFFADGEIPMTSSDTRSATRRSWPSSTSASLSPPARSAPGPEPHDQHRARRSPTPRSPSTPRPRPAHGRPHGARRAQGPVAVNDVRRWVQAMHYPNPLHYDERWASEPVRCDRGPAVVHRRHRHQPRLLARPGRPDPQQPPDLRRRRLVVLRPPDLARRPHGLPYRMPYDYKVTQTKFAGPTCFQRGDTLYINQRGERVALQRSTAIRYQVREAKEKKLFSEPKEPEWTGAQLAELDEQKQLFIEQIQTLRHEPPDLRVGQVGDQLAPNVLGPHSLASFTTEWRAFPMTTWGATAKGPTTVAPRSSATPKEMAGFEGDRRMERTNLLTDGAYYGLAAATSSPAGRSTSAACRAATATGPRWTRG